MKRLLCTTLLALALCTIPAHAQWHFGHSCSHPGVPPICLDVHSNHFGFNFSAGGGMTQLGPWYQYWPYQAHFQSPPPLGANMPPMSYQTLPPGFGQPGWGGYPQGIPTYWYGH